MSHLSFSNSLYLRMKQKKDGDSTPAVPAVDRAAGGGWRERGWTWVNLQMPPVLSREREIERERERERERESEVVYLKKLS